MSFVRYSGGRGRPQRVMGDVEERTWTVIAADVDGELQPDEVGWRQATRHVYFAHRQEAIAWLVEQQAEGWTPTGYRPAATFYFGPTDSPSNCWAASSEREL